MPDVEDGEMTRDNVKSKASQVLAAQVRPLRPYSMAETRTILRAALIFCVLSHLRAGKSCPITRIDSHASPPLPLSTAGEEEEAQEEGARGQVNQGVVFIRIRSRCDVRVCTNLVTVAIKRSGYSYAYLIL
jgi:hypothetical protein